MRTCQKCLLLAMIYRSGDEDISEREKYNVERPAVRYFVRTADLGLWPAAKAFWGEEACACAEAVADCSPGPTGRARMRHAQERRP